MSPLATHNAMRARCVHLAVAAALLWPCLASALEGGVPDIADLSLEELANIQVTSVSLRPERLADAAASVFVITAEDIRRSGADTLPEALRLAPNLQVAQVSGYGYSISARGLNGSNNSAPNKLLVLVDGRSVYSPLFSGVFWDQQDLMLEDVERIEVISGPGGTLWGVNAVNAVINVITRPAGATQGSLATLRAASNGGDAAFRSGGTSGALAWRAYGQVLGRGRNEDAKGQRVNDARRFAQVGMRADWQGGADQVSVNASAFRMREDQPEPGQISTGAPLALDTVTADGASILAHWQRLLASGATVSAQASADHTSRDVPPTFDETLDLIDLNLQYQLAPVDGHQFVVGGQWRHSWTDVSNSRYIAFLPARDIQSWSSLFAQDELVLAPALRLTTGARVEHNDYTGTEILPTLRLAWHASASTAWWAGISRTVRAPTRLDVDAYVPGQPPYLLRGGPLVKSEVAQVAELGYRGQPFTWLTASATLFHNRYDHLRTQEIDPSYTFITFDSQMKGKATGLEWWGQVQLMPHWRLAAGGTWLHQRFTLKPGSNDLAGPGTAGKDPAHTVMLRSSWSLDEDKEVEVGVRKVAALANPAVPAYTALDASFNWQLTRTMALSVTGRNLNGGHAEYGPLATRSEVPRSVAVKLQWQL